MDFSPANMEKLAEIFRPPEQDVLQGSDLQSNGSYSSKRFIGCQISSTRDKVPPLANISKTPKTIEEYEEIEARECEELSLVGPGLTERATPQYSMVYQQAVTAEDVFLQIGPKTPSSASCEHLILKIKMPGDKLENVDLSVDKTSVTVCSSRHYLKLPLPHGVDPDRSKANWDVSEETLIVTLKLDREFDFVNL